MLQMVRNMTAALGAILLFNSCDSQDIKGFLFHTSPGVEDRFEQSMTITSGQKTSTIQESSEYGVYVCTDPHIDNTSRNLGKFNYALRNDADASFGIILGDCTDRRDNLKAYMDAVACSKDKHAYEHPLFHLLGNHDVYFNGWNDFMEHIGPSTYWFEVRFNSGADLYIALDTASGTLGGKQTEWLEKFLENEREKYRYCIILSHTNFFYTDKCQVSTVNMPIDETLSLSRLLATYNVNLVLQGHNHFREDRIYDNVRYTVIGAIGDETKAPEYLKIKVQASGMTYDWILL